MTNRTARLLLIVVLLLSVTGCITAEEKAVEQVLDQFWQGWSTPDMDLLTPVVSGSVVFQYISAFETAAALTLTDADAMLSTGVWDFAESKTMQITDIYIWKPAVPGAIPGDSTEAYASVAAVVEARDGDQVLSVHLNFFLTKYVGYPWTIRKLVSDYRFYSDPL